MSTTFQPLEDRLIVLPIKKTEEEKTKAGIVTDMKKRETTTAVVVAVGQGYTTRDTGVFISTVLGKGDTVLIGINSGMEIDIPNEEGELIEHKMLREGDILALITKKE